MGEAPASRNTLNRRDVLRLSLASAASLAYGSLSGPETAAGKEVGKTRGTILVVLAGGMSSWDSFDYKPDAPDKLRGPFSGIPTKSGDAVFSELFPTLAAMDDRFLLLRGLHSPNLDHMAAYKLWLNASGEHITTTLGRKAFGIPYVHSNVPDVDPLFMPERAQLQINDAVRILWKPGEKRYELQAPFQKPQGADERVALLRQLNATSSLSSDVIERHEEKFQIAHRLLSGTLNDVLRGSSRDSHLREDFGDNEYGQLFHMAGILADKAEAGVVVVETGEWDHHEKLLQRMQPARKMDRAMGALLKHFGDRCTIAMRGEFGRSPAAEKTFGTPGRAHYPVHSGILAGPRVKTGVYGGTDKRFEINDGALSNKQFADLFLEAAEAVPIGTTKGDPAKLLKRA